MLSKIEKYIITAVKYAFVAMLAAAAIGLYRYVNYATSQYIGRISAGIVWDSDFGHMIAALFLLFAPLLIALSIKLYKAFELRLDERILFFILCVPFAVRFISFINNNIYDDMSVGRLIRAFLRDSIPSVQIITALLLAVFVSFTLRKQKESIEYLKVLAVLYILTGIFQTMNNAAIYVYYELFNRGAPWVSIQSVMGVLLNYMALAAAFYTLSFWHKYLPKLGFIEKFKKDLITFYANSDEAQEQDKGEIKNEDNQ